uniref:ATP synthase complex subunit 8 n=3 Tax=unclassified Stylotermes TaxID=2638625 RepID=A0A343L8X2_9NEOP|nr:ATP synthase subunit 8 [Stylotermes sp. TW5238]ATL76469.1 ATP synthase subunit 8 [Stylotermes sp. CN13]ATL76508.1 ATP synthase subunit 8 [Stylotermes sp. Chi-156]
MPQMMPMEWMTLYSAFLITFLLFNIINYFTQEINTQQKSTNKIKPNTTNWKW